VKLAARREVQVFGPRRLELTRFQQIEEITPEVIEQIFVDAIEHIFACNGG
jgi:hypothetical protein